jgi:hypothetical protein
MVYPDLRSWDDPHTRMGCVPGDGLEDPRTRALAVLQASGIMAIREIHDGERIPGGSHRSGTCAARAPQASMGLRSANSPAVLACRY